MVNFFMVSSAWYRRSLESAEDQSLLLLRRSETIDSSEPYSNQPVVIMTHFSLQMLFLHFALESRLIWLFASKMFAKRDKS